jgi:Kef-type K+ transport system membrane component KefB
MAESTSVAVRTVARIAAFHGLILTAAVTCFVGIIALGESSSAPPPSNPVIAVGEANINVLMHFLLALLTVSVTCLLAGRLLAWLRQPPVIGEMIAGLLLGPSFLCRVSPSLSDYLFPAQVHPILSIVAQLGIILYIFTVGLEFDLSHVRRQGLAFAAISQAGIIAPFLLGAALAVWMYPRLSSSDVRFTVFALFCGVAMAVTAFQVLARILTDRGLSRTRVGALALACAAFDDVTAWSLLALVVSVARSDLRHAFYVIASTLAYTGTMLLVARPLFIYGVRFQRNAHQPSREMVAVLMVAVLLSACATEFIGIHAVFGAFLIGVIIPHDSPISRYLDQNVKDFISVLLLPCFFAITGLRTRIDLIFGIDNLLICVLIILVATLGKFGGALAAARLVGVSWKDGTALGVLLNTRGLMELIVLNIGLDMRVISPKLFAMMVMMALTTTMATAPALDLLAPWFRKGRTDDPPGDPVDGQHDLQTGVSLEA